MLLCLGTALDAKEKPVSIEDPIIAKDRAFVGGGFYLQSQPYEDTDGFARISPVVFFDNELFYVRWTRLGMYFMGGKNWGASITVQPRPFGYETNDSSTFTGMADRNSSWEGGLSIAGKNDLGFAELSFFTDLLGNSDGSLLRFELGKKISSNKWTFVPSILAIYFDEKFNNYYYGVSQNEATAARAFYTAAAGLNLAAQSYINYDINKNWHLLGNVRADYLSSGITGSPIVGKSYMLSGLISVMYSFEY
jgi:outer membrane protein